MTVYRVVVTIADEYQARVREYAVVASKIEGVIRHALDVADTQLISITIEPENERIVLDQIKRSKLV